jgi:hypothetical protein
MATPTLVQKGGSSAARSAPEHRNNALAAQWSPRTRRKRQMVGRNFPCTRNSRASVGARSPGYRSWLNDKTLQVANVPAASLPSLSQAVESFVGHMAALRPPTGGNRAIARARGSTSMALNGAPNFRFAVSDGLGLKDFAADYLVVVARIPRDLLPSAQHRAARELLWSRPCRHPR